MSVPLSDASRLRRAVLATSALTLALTLGLVAACGSSGDEAVVSGPGDSRDAEPDTPVSDVPLTGASSSAPIAWTRIDPTTDLVSPRTAEPVELLADPEDDRLVLVRFYGGVQDCYGARASADETAEAVVVTLETGSQPDAGDRACIEIAQAQELAVELSAPLGDRRLTAAR